MNAADLLLTLAQGAGTVALVAVLAVAGLITLIVLMFVIQFFDLWLQAQLSGARVRFLDIIGMRLRKVEPRIVVRSRIRAVKAGLEISTAQLETHHLAGGRADTIEVHGRPGGRGTIRSNVHIPWHAGLAISRPGRSAGHLLIDGDYSQHAGILEIELGGAIFNDDVQQHDRLTVTGEALLDAGVLVRVLLIEQFVNDCCRSASALVSARGA